MATRGRLESVNQRKFSAAIAPASRGRGGSNMLDTFVISYLSEAAALVAPILPLGPPPLHSPFAPLQACARASLPSGLITTAPSNHCLRWTLVVSGEVAMRDNAADVRHDKMEREMPRPGRASGVGVGVEKLGPR